MALRIITDSTAGISQEEAAELDIGVVPLRSIFGKTEYLDGIDMTSEQFYEMLEAAEELPTTSQPTPHDFEVEYAKAQAVGDQILVITLPENLSGTFQSADIARKKSGADVALIDSGNATLALQLLVLRAIALRDAGASRDEIVTIIEREKKSVRLLAAIDTLDYLHKGGRLSKSSKIAGTLMNVKPIISLTNGEITIAGKARGTQKAYEKMLELIDQEGGIDLSRPFAIGYTGARAPFEQFNTLISKCYPQHTPIIDIVGSVIGTHAGPGAAAIAYFVHE